MRSLGDNLLVNHESTDDHRFALDRTAHNQRVLFLEVCHEAGPIVTTITLCRKDEPGHIL